METRITKEERKKVSELMKQFSYGPESSTYNESLNILIITWLNENNIQYENDDEIEKLFLKNATQEANDAYKQAKIGYVEFKLSNEFWRAREKLETFYLLVENEIIKDKYNVSINESISHCKFGKGKVVDINWSRINVYFEECGLKILHIAFLDDTHINYKKNQIKSDKLRN